ncbi:MAG TPA: hypothetical protein VH858_13530 [Hyphomicrobiales bacterium]|jgi:hypothetical protein
MIWPTLRRVLAVAAGFVLAMIAGLITLFFLGARWAAGEASAFTPDNADEISQALNQGLGVIAFFINVAPVLTLLPAIAAVAIGEVARVRSLLYYLIAGGLAAALMPLIATQQEATGSSTYSAAYFSIIATAGFAGGLIYWLIAGRNA